MKMYFLPNNNMTMSAIAKLQRKKLVDVCMDTFLTMTYTTAKRIKSFTSVNRLVVYRYLFSPGLVILFETMFRYLPSTFPTIPVMNVKQCIIVIGMMYWYGFRLGNKHKSNQSQISIFSGIVEQFLLASSCTLKKFCPEIFILENGKLVLKYVM